jgi:xylan 1,4-beta-xylosidase
MNMKYNNPVIKGFHPDPSICRVDEDYYLVNSSFEYFPGIPIFHSRDLVNWTQMGNCITNAKKFPLESVKDSGGIWAPTIRYDKGMFYVTATLEQHGNFIISAGDPAGEWSDPIWVSMGGIDPSLFFEKYRAYYCTNESLNIGKEEITLSVIDIHTGALIGEQRTIWEGTGGGYLEAPHIYHIGDLYYLIAAEGGTFFNHMITIARSKSIWGPYESCPDNPILTNAHDTSKEVQCSGHGDLFKDHHGNWWIVHLATRLSRRAMTNLGRETFLTPVVWKNGWPSVENKKAVLSARGPLWACQKPPEEWKADFTQVNWEPEWIFLRNPIESSYKREVGMLKLYPTPVTLQKVKNPTFVAIRQRDFETETFVEFLFEPSQEGDEAGIAIVLSSDFHYTFSKRRTSEGNFIVVEKRAEDFNQIAYCAPIAEGVLRIKVKSDKEFYTFSYSIVGKAFQQVCSASTRFLSCEVASKCFTGTVIGLYAVSADETDAVMEVMDFSSR